VKRILVTGASGCIGRHCLPQLVARSYEVHAVSSRPLVAGPSSSVQWHRADLLKADDVSQLIAKVRPTHMLHLAWYVVPGQWAQARENYFWVQASLDLLRQFHAVGGTRVVMAGSCMEYDWRDGYCSEGSTPTNSATFYGACKNAIRLMLEGYSRTSGFSGAWGRIFFLYGPYEHPMRLVASVIRSLLRGEPARCSHGAQRRDYLYVADVAAAFTALVDNELEGPINIASGQATAVKDIVGRIATRLGREDLVRLGAIPTDPDEAPLVVGDVRRLNKELGWRPQYDLDTGLEETIAWWRGQLSVPVAAEARS